MEVDLLEVDAGPLSEDQLVDDLSEEAKHPVGGLGADLALGHAQVGADDQENLELLLLHLY